MPPLPQYSVQQRLSGVYSTAAVRLACDEGAARMAILEASGDPEVRALAAELRQLYTLLSQQMLLAAALMEHQGLLAVPAARRPWWRFWAR